MSTNLVKVSKIIYNIGTINIQMAINDKLFVFCIFGLNILSHYLMFFFRTFVKLNRSSVKIGGSLISKKKWGSFSELKNFNFTDN